MICSCANGQYFSSIVGHWRPPGTEREVVSPSWYRLQTPLPPFFISSSTDPSVKTWVQTLWGNLSVVRARVMLLSSPGSCSFELMSGTPRNIRTSASLSGLQAGSVSSSIGASTKSRCFLHSSLYWWFRLWRLRRFFFFFFFFFFCGLCQVCVSRVGRQLS